MFEVVWEAPARDLWVAAAGVLVLGWLAWKVGPKPKGILALRWIALLLLAAALARPSLLLYEQSVTKPGVSVWVDSSAWMAIEEDGRTRLDSALRWLGAARKGLEEKAEVAYFRVADAPARVEFEELDERPAGGLRLDKAFQNSVPRGSEPSVWLLSDGVGDLSEDLEGALSRFNGKVNVLAVGRSRQPRGITLRALSSPDFVFLHEPFDVKLDWEASGLAGKPVRVRLTQNGRLLAEERAIPSSDFQTMLSTLTVRTSSLGSQDYRIEIEPEGDARGATREGFRVEVIRQKLRILYLSGRPSYEYSALREFIRADPSNELVSFVILRNQENVSPVPENELSLIPFPAQEIFVQSLFGFDLFIFHDFAFWRFGLPQAYLESVRQFVDRGGALLVIGGENSFGGGQYRGTPIEELLPVSLPPAGAPYEAGLFRPKPTESQHPLVRFEGAPDWGVLPPLDGLHRFGPAKKGTTVIASAPSGDSVFASREYGKGRVFLSGSNSTWRWKLGAGLDWRVGAFYDRFWSRAFQYLTGGLDLKRVKFAPLPAKPLRPAVSLHVFDEGFRPLSGPSVKVQILRSKGEGRWEPLPFRELRPGVFEAEAGPGRHKIRGVVQYQGKSWGEDEIELSWTPPGMRFEPVDESFLRRLAERTGGTFARIGAADPKAWVSALPEPRPSRKVRSRVLLWSHSAWLWAVAALLTLEWFLRRRRGYR